MMKKKLKELKELRDRLELEAKKNNDQRILSIECSAKRSIGLKDI